jgi:ribosomal protein S18 acetylase RimI-like enzyme
MTPDMAIRPMLEADLEDVRRVEAAAFEPAWRASRGGRRPRRTALNARVRLEKDPDGCFVAEQAGRLVGIVFSRTWGRVGWPGSLAVLPAFQGRGIGRQLLAASLHYLGTEPGRLIGLETSPTDSRNLTLYARWGFRVRGLTLHLAREVERGDFPARSVARWSEAGDAAQSRWLDELRLATGKLIPGLDYGKEIVFLERYAVGETLVLVHQGHAIGLAALAMASPFEGWGEEAAIVQAVALDPHRTSERVLRSLVQGAEAAARACGKTRLRLVFSAHHVWAIDRMLDWGYAVERVGLQMALRGAAPSHDEWVDGSRWAG